MSLGELWLAIEIGMIFSLVTLGVYITYRICDIPDLTVDGSMTTGGAILAVAMTHGTSPLLATCFAVLGGCLAGLCSGLLHTWGRISALLSGIITMIALYSINLRIMGTSNIGFFQLETLFNQFGAVAIVLCMIPLTFVMVYLFLVTDCGLALRAGGGNPRGGVLQGIQVNQMKILSLMLSNGLVALAGALMAQLQGFTDITMGNGMIIIGIASLIIGESLLKTSRLFLILSSCILGAVIYRLVISLALHVDWLGLQASDLNLITAMIVVFFLLSPRIKQWRLKTAKAV